MVRIYCEICVIVIDGIDCRNSSLVASVFEGYVERQNKGAFLTAGIPKSSISRIAATAVRSHSQLPSSCHPEETTAAVDNESLLL